MAVPVITLMELRLTVMKRIVLGASVVLGLALAGPVGAGTVYVVMASDESINSIGYHTVLQVSNTSDSPRSFTTYFIKSFTDGTDRPEKPALRTEVVAPRTTFYYAGLSGGEAHGMLEVTGDDALVFSAKLVPRIGGGEGLGERVPLISSNNVVPGGRTQHVQGVKRFGDLFTTYGLANISQTPNQCTADVTYANGLAAIPTTVLVLPPLSHQLWPDVLEAIGVVEGDGLRIAVTCSGASYSFGVLRQMKTGETSLLPLSETGSSLLVPPGEGPECAAGSVCFEQKGIYHIPSPGNEVFHINYPMAEGQIFRTLRVRLTFQHGGWDQKDPFGLHNIFWIVRNVWASNNFGYVNTKGPNFNQVLNNTNVDLPEGQNQKNIVNVALVPGETYKLVLDRLMTSYVFRRGHRLRVQVSTAFFPHFSRNLHTGALETESSDFRTAVVTIHHDAEHPSRVVLPVVDW